jgi:hypothetical protein
MESNYIDKIADAIEEIASTDRQLLRIYAVLTLAKGLNTTREDVHDAWSAWRIVDQPNHQFIVPFDDISSDVQELDEPYVAAIHEVARKLSHGEI